MLLLSLVSDLLLIEVVGIDFAVMDLLDEMDLRVLKLGVLSGVVLILGIETLYIADYRYSVNSGCRRYRRSRRDNSQVASTMKR